MSNGEFLGPAQFTAVKNTTSFMRIAIGTGRSQEGNTKEILVLYRYTHFSRKRAARRGGVPEDEAALAVVHRPARRGHGELPGMGWLISGPTDLPRSFLLGAETELGVASKIFGPLLRVSTQRPSQLIVSRPTQHKRGKVIDHHEEETS